MRAITLGSGSLGLAFVLLTACGGGGEAPAADETPAADEAAAPPAATGTGGYTVVNVTDGGTISGTVRFSGTVPPAREITVDEDTETCGGTFQQQLVQVGASGGLANAVVSITDITEGAAFAPASPPTLDQQGCRFVPHVVIAPVGTMNVLNSDPLTHNVHTAAFDNRPVNRSQPASVREIELEFTSPEKVRVRCDIHSWMGAWIIVAEHPYYAVTDENGGFVLENVPPGSYMLEYWHETLGTTSQAVTVTAGQTADASVQLSQQG